MIAFAVNNDIDQVSIAYVVLEKNNITRMEAGDPVTMPPWDLTKILSNVKYPQKLGVVLCYESDGALLRALMASNNLSGLLEHLTRNLTLTEADDKPVGIIQMQPRGTAQA